jgi:hypothetical protein
LKKYPKIPEALIYKTWEEKRFDSHLITFDGQSIEIIDCGIRNNDEAGPDYNHARIRIGNLTFTGDVEIDTYHSDWKSHGHFLNQRYNKIILHVVLKDNSNSHCVFTSNGRKVHTIELEKFLTIPFIQNIQEDINSINEENEIIMPCSQLNYIIERKDKLQLLKNLGLIRFRKKCEKNIERLKEIVVLNELNLKEPKVYHNFHEEINSHSFNQQDFENPTMWQQLLYEQIFEALGYSKNKDGMLKLSRAADINFFKSITELKTQRIESILFHISGLFPEVTEIADEETSEYIRNSLDYWTEIKSKYDSGVLKSTDWHFFKLRPLNFPTIRIAAGSRLLEKILNRDLVIKFSNLFQQHVDANKLINKLRNEIIISGEGYWASHYNFYKETKSKLNYFIGLGRADEIITNIILPFYSVYFELLNKKESSQRVLELYLNYYQKEGNNLVDNVNEILGLKNEKSKSVYYQGMIELFREYCFKSKCLECQIGKRVFN